MFLLESGVPVPAVSTEQMRTVDQTMIETFGWQLYLADISVPPQLYAQLGVQPPELFRAGPIAELFHRPC